MGSSSKLMDHHSAALWPTDIHNTSLERYDTWCQHIYCSRAWQYFKDRLCSHKKNHIFIMFFYYGDFLFWSQLFVCLSWLRYDLRHNLLYRKIGKLIVFPLSPSQSWQEHTKLKKTSYVKQLFWIPNWERI